jgi:kynurenine 3-monooxygenase
VISADGDGSYRIAPHALHIWPRRDLMLMALPNQDGSFTVTLFLPFAGADGFDALQSESDVLSLFERFFPNALPLIPDLARTFFENPTGKLGTVRCQPWNTGGGALLVGDAAHAIVPFFGQGMNSGFEDCTLLDDLLRKHPRGAWQSVFADFNRVRKSDAEAIADMALENFVEMRDSVADADFLLGKQIDHRLEQAMPQLYRSRYSMVMYSHIPFATAFAAGAIQHEIRDELRQGIDHVDELDLERARDLIDRKLTPFLREHGVSLDY